MKTSTIFTKKAAWGLLCFALFVLSAFKTSAQAPQFYVSTYSGGANNFPFNASSGNGSKCQWLYAPGQFKDSKSTNAYPGLITSIYIYTASGSSSHTFTNLKVELGQTTITSLSSGSWHTSLQTCLYRNITLTGAGSSRWVEIPLDKPFSYDPKKALIISIENSGMSAGFTVNQESMSWTARMYGDRASSSSSGADAAQLVAGIDVKVPGPNNAGIVSIDSPSVFCGGTKAVYATVGNYGNNQITEVTLNWEVDGKAQTAVTYKGTLDTIGGKGKNEAMVYLGLVSFSAPRNILVYSTMPNGTQDKITLNDSLSQKIAPSLQGTYTIGGTKSYYKTVKEAADDLSNFGVCSAVKFIVRKGTYTGAVVLNKVPGASSVNTIEFVSPSKDSVLLTHSSDGTVSIIGTDYVSFEKFNIRATGSSGAAVFLTGGADYNRFSGCIIEASTSVTSSTLNPLVISSSVTNASGYGNNGNYNLFEDNDIRGGYYGAIVLGSSTSAMSEGNSFVRNNFNRSYYYGLRFYYVSGGVFHDNVIKDFRYAYNYGVYCYYISNFDWQRNKIINSYYGNYFAYANYYNYKSNRSTFANNSLSGLNSSYGLYAYYMSYTDFYHNSMYGKGSYLMYCYYMNNMNIQNNIFYYEGTSYAIYTYNPTSILSWDNNNYYLTSGTLAYISGSVYTNMSALKGWNANYNQNSYDEDPDWVDPEKDHHIGTKFPELYGPYLGFDVDFDGDKRCTLVGTLGSDEFVKSSLLPTANFSVPDTAWVGSETIILNGSKPSKSEASKWYVNGKLAGTEFNLSYTPKKPGVDSIKLVMMNCSGNDSITKAVVVSALLRKPKADFGATNRYLFVGESTKFLDLTQYGPTKWNWVISPVWAKKPGSTVRTRTFTYKAPFDSTSANPEVTFLYPGMYRVSLKASNKFGFTNAGQKDFIIVRENAIMCGSSKITSGDIGVLFDDGGQFGNYTAHSSGSKICNYLVTTCAGTPEFDMDVFDLGTGDYLRVYDGEDASGTPLWDINNYPKGMEGDKTNKSVVSTFSASTGSAYFEFEVDGNIYSVGKGFAIEWEVNAVKWKDPVANFSFPDTVCVGYPVNFQNTTSGIYKSISWDLGADATEDGTGETFTHTFTATGKYKMQLKANSYCAKASSITRNITVINAAKAPRPNFSASNTKVATLDTVALTDLTKYCSDYTRWEITPANYILAYDGKLTDNTLNVIFYKGGLYDIKLVKGNSFGQDSIIKSKHIEVLHYCIPAVANSTQDLSISRVAFHTIDNKSGFSLNGYTNFMSQSTEVERARSYTITIERPSSNGLMTRKVWIDWNIDGDFDDANELVSSEPMARTLSFSDTIIIPASATAGATRMRVSTNYKDQKNLACGPHQFGEFEDYSIIISDKDQSAPTLTLYGNKIDTIEVFDTWTEPGYEAYDLLDGDLKSKVIVNNTLDNTTIGTYTIGYRVFDAANNSASDQRTIYVVDTKKPSISLLGNNPLKLHIHSTYTEPGVSYADNYDKTLMVEVSSNLDTASLGEYIITYCVTDISGNGPVCVQRKVIVVDTVAPTIALVGAEQVTVEQCRSYKDQGYTVSDNDFAKVTTSGTWVNSAQGRGVFTIVYTATDNAGNSASVTRYIDVIDNELPRLKINGKQIDSVARWAPYTDLGVSAEDFCNPSTEVSITKGGDFVNTQSVGLYTITYIGEDASGNKSAEAVRVIIVVEDLKGTGITDNMNAAISLYPNPTTGKLVLLSNHQIDKQTVLVVFNMQGAEVFRAINLAIDANNQLSVDLSKLAAGTYQVQLLSTNFNELHKLLIVK